MLLIKTLKNMERILFWKRKDITRIIIILLLFFFSSLSTKKLKPTNNTLYREKRNFFFVIHLHRYRDAKILLKFREIMWDKVHYQKS